MDRIDDRVQRSARRAYLYDVRVRARRCTLKLVRPMLARVDGGTRQMIWSREKELTILARIEATAADVRDELMSHPELSIRQNAAAINDQIPLIILALSEAWASGNADK